MSILYIVSDLNNHFLTYFLFLQNNAAQTKTLCVFMVLTAMKKSNLRKYLVILSAPGTAPIKHKRYNVEIMKNFYKKNAYDLKTPHIVSVKSYSSLSSLASQSMKASMNSESHSIKGPLKRFLIS